MIIAHKAKERLMFLRKSKGESFLEVRSQDDQFVFEGKCEADWCIHGIFFTFSSDLRLNGLKR